MRKAFAFIGFSSARPGMGENTHKPSSAALAAELERLPSLDFDELIRIWKVRIGRRVPAHLPRYLFVPLLAHRLQAQTLGDLDRSVRPSPSSNAKLQASVSETRSPPRKRKG